MKGVIVIRVFLLFLVLIFSSSSVVNANTDEERAKELPLKVMQQCATAQNFWVCVENKK